MNLHDIPKEISCSLTDEQKSVILKFLWDRKSMEIRLKATSKGYEIQYFDTTYPMLDKHKERVWITFPPEHYAGWKGRKPDSFDMAKHVLGGII